MDVEDSSLDPGFSVLTCVIHPSLCRRGQIYNEKIADLLDPNGLSKLEHRTHLKIREDGSGGVYVDGLSEHIVKTTSEIADLLRLGSSMRTTGTLRPP